MMSKSLKQNLIILGVVGLILAGAFYTSSILKANAQTTENRIASGYAWSDNIGWLSFRGDVGVTSVCGNNIKEGTEVCDGSVSSDTTCATQLGSGYTGNLSCNNTCSSYVTSSCVPPCTPDSPLTQIIAGCSVDQIGTITQTRTSTCPKGATVPNTSAWTTTSSACVTQVTVPGAPTNVTATTEDSQATISFTAPASNGGSPISGYTITSSQGGITKTGLASPITVTGLINGTSYSFTVTATNVMGIGPASTPPISVIIGLKWSAELGTVTWYTASATCAGHGWRLPTIGELLTALTNRRVEIGFQTNASYLSSSEANSGVVELGIYYSSSGGGVGSAIVGKGCTFCSARCVYY